MSWTFVTSKGWYPISEAEIVSTTMPPSLSECKGLSLSLLNVMQDPPLIRSTHAREKILNFLIPSD